MTMAQVRHQPVDRDSGQFHGGIDGTTGQRRSVVPGAAPSSSSERHRRVDVFEHRSSIPVDEAAVAAALEILRLMPGGIEYVSVAVLTLFARTMAWQDFAALRLEVAKFTNAEHPQC
jgi:hypothetical protein